MYEWPLDPLVISFIHPESARHGIKIRPFPRNLRIRRSDLSANYSTKGHRTGTTTSETSCRKPLSLSHARNLRAVMPFLGHLHVKREKSDGVRDVGDSGLPDS